MNFPFPLPNCKTEAIFSGALFSSCQKLEPDKDQQLFTSSKFTPVPGGFFPCSALPLLPQWKLSKSTEVAWDPGRVPLWIQNAFKEIKVHPRHSLFPNSLIFLPKLTMELNPPPQMKVDWQPRSTASHHLLRTRLTQPQNHNWQQMVPEFPTPMISPFSSSEVKMRVKYVRKAPGCTCLPWELWGTEGCTSFATSRWDFHRRALLLVNGPFKA